MQNRYLKKQKLLIDWDELKFAQHLEGFIFSLIDLSEDAERSILKTLCFPKEESEQLMYTILGLKWPNTVKFFPKYKNKAITELSIEWEWKFVKKNMILSTLFRSMPYKEIDKNKALLRTLWICSIFSKSVTLIENKALIQMRKPIFTQKTRGVDSLMKEVEAWSRKIDNK